MEIIPLPPAGGGIILRPAGRRIFQFVLNALFPRFCAGCHEEGLVWCQKCAVDFVPPAPTIDLAPTPHLDGCISLFPYADPRVRGIVTGWKYHGDAAYRAVLEQWITDFASGPVPAPLLLGNKGETLQPEGVVTPIPLHEKRLRSRGFNQAEAISHTLASTLDVPHADMLVRTRHTAPQANIDHEKRRASDLAGAFIVPLPFAKQGGDAEARGGLLPRVILCDDVFTTGATMDAAAATLKAAGVKEVWGFTVAKG